jgi:Fe-S-cluster-containing hydrogenase component 2
MDLNTRNTPERIALERQWLENGEFFKTICGAGNEDADEVERLSYVYTLAGTRGIDVSARPEVVAAARRGIKSAHRDAETFEMEVFDPSVTVSIGMPGDHHVRKAVINEACTQCNACIPVCPTDAIPDALEIIQARCIGCGACGIACSDNAIDFFHNEINTRQALEACISEGAESIELHVAIPDHEATLREWDVVVETLPDGLVSVCLDRGHLSNRDLVERIERMAARAPNRTIIQADGVPMSGGRNDYNTTLQAIACADIVVKSQIPVFVLLSGGTNGLSAELAKLAGVPFAGVAIGTYARHLVYPFINQEGFLGNDELIRKAVSVASTLVNASLR